MILPSTSRPLNLHDPFSDLFQCNLVSEYNRNLRINNHHFIFWIICHLAHRFYLHLITYISNSSIFHLASKFSESTYVRIINDTNWVTLWWFLPCCSGFRLSHSLQTVKILMFHTYLMHSPKKITFTMYRTWDKQI